MDRLNKILGPRDPIAVPPRSQLPILVEPPRRSFRPMLIFAIGLIVLLTLVNFVNRPHEVTAFPISPSSASALPGISSGSGGVDVVVNVVGDVKTPGLVTLPAGSRIADAIAGAGGATKPESIGMLNLAARVVDGQQIVVLPEVNAFVPGGSSGSSSNGKINLNTATETQLDDLPGVGPVMAGRIISWRTQHNAFSTVEELQEVPGIGPKVFADLVDLVTV